MTQTRTRLIVLIDFSLYAQALVELASRWSEIANADLVFVHKVAGIVPAMADSDTKASVIEAEKKDALEKLKKWTDEKVPASTNVTFLVSDASLVETLTGLLDEGTNDFILVGIKGTGMLKRILMGSVATHVINELNQTTIAVPERLCANNVCHLRPRHVVVTLTDKYPLNETALNNFLSTFRQKVESLMFVSVLKEDEPAGDDREMLSGLTERYNRQVRSSYKILRGKNAFDEIKSYLHGEEDTVLVVQKGSRTLTDQFFRKFFINQIVNDGSLPMIVLPVGD